MIRYPTPFDVRPVTLAMVLTLSACAPMKTIDSTNAQATLEEFSTGRTQLSNGPGGIGNYVNNRGALHALQATKDWSSLAKRVIQIDYGNDLSWFYLGLSAQGLGFDDAAKAYYLKASSAIVHCRPPGGDDCDGFRFPDDIIVRLSRLQAPAAAPVASGPPRNGNAVSEAADAAAARLTAQSANAATSTSPAVRPSAPSTAPKGVNALDILGIRIGMGASEVQSILVSNGYKTDVTRTFFMYSSPLNGNFAYDETNPMVSEITGELIRTNDPRLPKDTISVFLTPEPGSERVFSIARSVNYSGTQQPGVLLGDLRGALAQKYGKPLVDGPYTVGTHAMFWSTFSDASEMKVWFQEPKGAGIAYVCQSRGHAGQGGLLNRTSSLGAADDPMVIADHCGKTFVSINMIRSSSFAGQNAGDVVTNYNITLFDSATAKQGKDSLLAGNARAAERAASAQSQKASTVKPKL